MRAFVWSCLGVLATSFGLMMVFFYPFKHPLRQELGALSIVVEPLLMLLPLCALWMIYQAIRYEAKPFPYVVLALFVPLAFIWYYWEKFRPRQNSKRSPS